MYKINKISPQDHPYLQISTCIADCPNTFYYIGSLPDTRRPSVAIVGSRRPTPYGREVTEQLASELAQRGVVIISGLALGVDAIAHQATLDAGGTTIAVQANGLDRLYPTSNRRLGEAIATSGGAILSEYEKGVEPMQHRFLERNRIVSGLADIVVITEAAARSGTLNTAAHALEQGKPVFAVPGNITSPMSAGCNQLLRQGAIPLTSLQDVLEALQLSDESHGQLRLLPKGANALEGAIIAALDSGIRDGEVLLTTTGAKAQEFSMALTMLEINGIVAPLGANQWRLR